jgi:hypothetical protein
LAQHMEVNMARPNWFPTLNDALAAVGLVRLWPLGKNVRYGETAAIVAEGRYVSVYRDEQGLYERPILYATKRATGS